jgi:D-ribulokinase
VAAGLIDAHAGALALLAPEEQPSDPVGVPLAAVCGTSACFLMQTAERRPVPGVWGPYADVLYQGGWVLEAGQSACGAALSAVLHGHASWQELAQEAIRASADPYELLSREVASVAHAAGLTSPWLLASDMHVLPDFNGNRSPWADPGVRGVVSGLPLHVNRSVLVGLYVATVLALGCGVRAILDAMAARGVHVSQLRVTGGLSHNAGMLLLRGRDAMQAC